MPSFLTSVVEIESSTGARVDQPTGGHYQPIVLKLGTGFTGTSRDRGDGLTEVLLGVSLSGTHGDLGGGTLHAVATESVAGFMSAADKLNFDTLMTYACAVSSAAPVNVTKATASAGAAATAARRDHKHDVTTAAPVSVSGVGANTEGSATSLARSDHIHSLPTELVPTPVVDGGADATGVVKTFDLLPHIIKTLDNGSHDYLWDIGSTTLPADVDANVLVDFTVHLYGDSADKVPLGCWKTSGTWSRNASGYLTVIGQSTILDVDVGAHTYRPGLSAGTYSTNDHTVKLSITAPTNATYHWVITTHVEASYFTGS
jgi:hypothetical protein